MRWERNLRDPIAKGTRWDRHYEWNYLAIILMFWSLGVASILAGVYRALSGKNAVATPTAVWIAAGVALGTMAIGLFLTLRKLATVCETAGSLRRLRKMYWRERRKPAGKQDQPA